MSSFAAAVQINAPCAKYAADTETWEVSAQEWHSIAQESDSRPPPAPEQDCSIHVTTQPLDAAAREFGIVRALFYMDRTFEGWKPSAAWANTKLDVQH